MHNRNSMVVFITMFRASVTFVAVVDFVWILYSHWESRRFLVSILASYHRTPNIFLSSPLTTIISSIEFYKLTISPQNSPGVKLGMVLLWSKLWALESHCLELNLTSNHSSLCLSFFICEVDIMMHLLVLLGRNCCFRKLLSIFLWHPTFALLKAACSLLRKIWVTASPSQVSPKHPGVQGATFCEKTGCYQRMKVAGRNIIELIQSSERCLIHISSPWNLSMFSKSKLLSTQQMHSS